MSLNKYHLRSSGYEPAQITNDAAEAIGFKTQFCIYCRQMPADHQRNQCPFVEESKGRRFNRGELTYEKIYESHYIEDPDALEPSQSREERRDQNIAEFDIEDRKYKRAAERAEKERKRVQAAEEERMARDIAEAAKSSMGESGSGGNEKGKAVEEAVIQAKIDGR